MDVERRLPQLHEEQWIQTTREFLQLSKLQLWLTDTPVRTPKRKKDRFIMDIVTSDRQFTQNDVILINMCRIHMQVETISDITEALGRKISTPAIECAAPHTANTTSYGILWPRQPRPENQKPWLTFLKSICADNSDLLWEPLGEWLEDPLSRPWEAYYDPEERTVT
jgi:hypothetical protein